MFEPPVGSFWGSNRQVSKRHPLRASIDPLESVDVKDRAPTSPVRISEVGGISFTGTGFLVAVEIKVTSCVSPPINRECLRLSAVTADVPWLAAVEARSLFSRDLWLFAVAPGAVLAAAVNSAQVSAVSGRRIAALASSEATSRTAFPPAAFLAFLATFEGASAAHKGK